MRGHPNKSGFSADVDHQGSAVTAGMRNAFFEAWQVYQSDMFDWGWRLYDLHPRHIVLMSLVGLSLGELLASTAHLRSAQRSKCSTSKAFKPVAAQPQISGHVQPNLVAASGRFRWPTRAEICNLSRLYPKSACK